MRGVRGLQWAALVVAAGGSLAGCVPPDPSPPPAAVDSPQPPAPPRQDRTDQIVFVGSGGIWTMHGDATDVHQLTNDGGIQPEVSRDGQKIAYTRTIVSAGANYTRIWVMNADGSDQHEVFAVPVIDPNKPEPLTNIRDSSPSWSPDGSQIAFIRNGGFLVPVGIMVMNADGGGGHRILHEAEPRLGKLAWSPDDATIAHSFLFHDSTTHIDLANADGSGSTFWLTGEHPPFNTARDDEPAWSPDGAQIAYSGNVSQGKPGISLIRADGSNARQLTLASDDDPSFAPDGTRIAFSRSGSIWTMAFDGTDQVNTLVAGGDPNWGP